MKRLKWREWWKYPRKKIDLLSGTEDGYRWRVRLVVNALGDLSVKYLILVSNFRDYYI